MVVASWADLQACHPPHSLLPYKDMLGAHPRYSYCRTSQTFDNVNRVHLLRAMQDAEPTMASLRDLMHRETDAPSADLLTLFVPTEAAFREVESVVSTLDTQTFTDVRSCIVICSSVVDIRMFGAVFGFF